VKRRALEIMVAFFAVRCLEGCETGRECRGRAQLGLSLIVEVCCILRVGVLVKKLYMIATDPEHARYLLVRLAMDGLWAF